ncbi:hypothetical protein ACM66Z_00285 [Sulfurovum sp. ST-21]|uniref:PepSY domain-containing protein n=1 Tax=Sulfurovum indicum TaxID=2779528 RepID=A0A7M1S3S5_9BACT|nr:hypothetical protein [Sulfurovum indicum]QOR61966.1 hypothetical protein IMZ28_00285 [Sulfurovum indicum]
MKIILWVIPFFMAGMAAAEQLKIESSIPLRIYNHRPSVQLQHQQRLRQLCKIKPEEARWIALKVCHARKLRSRKLKHKGQLLFYRIATEHCTVEINALDGAVISKITDQNVNEKGKKQ